MTVQSRLNTSTRISWFVAYTAPAAEERAARFLSLRLFGACVVYWPRLSVRRLHARTVEWVVRPLLPRYLFVQDAGQAVAQMRMAPGVAGLVRGVDARPIRVDGATVAELRAREGPDGLIAAPAEQVELVSGRRRLFRQGDAVRVSAAPLLVGRFVRYAGLRHADIQLSMFHRTSLVRIDLIQLERM